MLAASTFASAMRRFPFAELAIAERQLFSFVLEDVERLRRLGQECEC